MANHLWFKLTSAFALIILIGVIVTTLLTRQGADAHFAHFMIEQHMVRPEVMLQALADFYVQEKGWHDLQSQLSIIVESSSDGVMGDVMGSMMGMTENRIQIVDEEIQVIGDTSVIGTPDTDSQTLLSGQSVQRWPILVDEKEVGVLLAEGALMTASPVRNERLVQGVTRAVLLSGLTAGLVGVVLAWLLVRQITRPLAKLTVAAERIAQGDLQARATVHSLDEVGALAKTFNRMAANLQTQENLRRNLMADVAHELRTPLTGIQGTVEAIQDGVFPLSIDQIGSIHEQVTLLNRLVEDLRMLAHVEAGQLRLDKQWVDLVVLCEKQLAAFQAQANEQQITIKLIVQGKPPLIDADSQRIDQILNNLLSNALRHSPPHSEIELNVTISPPDGVQIAITDEGEGIDAEDLPHIFDRFYRADPSRNRHTGGSGLGLAIARQLVEAHDGKIWAESPPIGRTKGSRFTILLSEGRYS